MKYALISGLFLVNNEIVSYLALTIIALMVCADLLKARFS